MRKLLYLASELTAPLQLRAGKKSTSGSYAGREEEEHNCWMGGMKAQVQRRQVKHGGSMLSSSFEINIGAEYRIQNIGNENLNWKG